MESNPWAPENWAVDSGGLRSDVPLVTLGVLSYNRCQDLQSTLDVLTNAIQYPNYEILVVDNGSNDGSPEMVAERYPDVRLLRLDTNLGTSSRNLQFANARGKYLFSFDDDSFPGTPATVLRIVQFMEANTDISVLNGSCYQPRTGILETRGWEKYRYGSSDGSFEGIYLVEGGVCFRMSDVRNAAAYDPSIFYAAEGPDLALQLYQQGKRVCLAPQFLTLHFKSAAARANQRYVFWGARHTVWMIAKHFPLYATVPLVSLFFLRRVVLGSLLDPQSTRARLEGFWEGVRDVAPFLKRRPKLTLRQTLNLKRFYLQLYRW